LTETLDATTCKIPGWRPNRLYQL